MTVLRWILPLAGLWLWQAAMADMPRPFEAVYEIRVDGKPRLESRISLSQEGAHWVLRSTTTGTRGLAGFLNISSEERSEGVWHEGQFRPHSYQHQSSVAGAGEQWEATFDWTARAVTTRTEEGEFKLEIGADTSDPLSLILALGKRLRGDEHEISAEVVDEDTIDVHRFQRKPPHLMQTALGCVEVTELERMRERSQRYSSGWYAKEFSYLPVRVRHGKRGGKEFDMRILHLSLDGNPAIALADCPL